jgi:DNA-binding MarR family transcriptional regulator
LLFEEAVDLANYLKRKARHTHRGEPLSASGRILLQSLQLHGPQTVPALAHIRSTSRQNIQSLANRLAQAGLVAFVPNPDHKRSAFVTLTGRGRDLLRTANGREAVLFAGLLPHTSRTEVRQSAELLRRLRLMLGGERKRRKAAPSPAAEITQHEVVSGGTVTASSRDLSPEAELPVSLL